MRLTISKAAKMSVISDVAFDDPNGLLCQLSLQKRRSGEVNSAAGMHLANVRFRA
jgi:hypothetical protein